MSKPFEFRISLVGNTRVGKTTLAASMVDALKDEIYKINEKEHEERKKNPKHKLRTMRLLPSVQTGEILVEKRNALRNLAGDPSPSIETVDIAGFGTAEANEYLFDIDVDESVGSSADIRMVFYDPPGGFYDKGSNVSLVREAIENSSMLILAVHTPAMMHNNKYHTDINIPSQIQNALETIDPKNIGAIMFALIRCEKYVKNQKDRKILFEATTAAYADLLRWAKSKGIICYACPVQTLGNIEFLKFETFDNTRNGWNETYVKKGGGYKPQNCDAPLYLAVTEAIRMALGLPANQENIFDDIFKILGMPSSKTKTVEAMRKLLEVFHIDRAESPFQKIDPPRK